MIRLDFPGYSGADSLEEIEWDQFFEKFDEQGLALLVQDKTARGQKSNFNKLVSRQTAEMSGSGAAGVHGSGSTPACSRGGSERYPGPRSARDRPCC